MTAVKKKSSAKQAAASAADTPLSDVPGVGKPAVRALTAAGYATLGALNDADWSVLKELHGVGPSAGERLQAALVASGLGLRNAPQVKSRRPVVTREHTGVNAADIKTTITKVAPKDFLETLSERRREDGQVLLELFGEATGERPVMWGPSMIGYGKSHYAYASGRQGDWFHLGFSPRKANIALYGLQGAPRSKALLAKLGRHKAGAGCVWVNQLRDIDLQVLRELVAHAWAQDPAAGKS